MNNDDRLLRMPLELKCYSYSANSSPFHSSSSHNICQSLEMPYRDHFHEEPSVCMAAVEARVAQSIFHSRQIQLLPHHSGEFECQRAH
jgi:hypothetical protein